MSKLTEARELAKWCRTAIVGNFIAKYVYALIEVDDELEKTIKRCDRLLAELNYLNGQFNGEYFCCSVCGHEETTSNMDSAIHLREFLTNFATTTADR